MGDETTSLTQLCAKFVVFFGAIAIRCARSLPAKQCAMEAVEIHAEVFRLLGDTPPEAKE